MLLPPDIFQIIDYGFVKTVLVQTVLHLPTWYLLDEKQIDPINVLFVCSYLISIMRFTDCIVKADAP